MKKKRKKKNQCGDLLLHPSLGSAPDVPASHKLSNRESSFADVLFGVEKDNINFQEKLYEIKITENSATKWSTIVCGQRMYILIPTDLSQAGSKESFVALLEIAEEDLGCTTVIGCMKNTKADRSERLRTFMYMGFTPIPPANPMLSDTTGGSDDFIFLGYEL